MERNLRAGAASGREPEPGGERARERPGGRGEVGGVPRCSSHCWRVKSSCPLSPPGRSERPVAEEGATAGPQGSRSRGTPSGSRSAPARRTRCAGRSCRPPPAWVGRGGPSAGAALPPPGSGVGPGAWELRRLDLRGTGRPGKGRGAPAAPRPPAHPGRTVRTVPPESFWLTSLWSVAQPGSGGSEEWRSLQGYCISAVKAVGDDQRE